MEKFIKGFREFGKRSATTDVTPSLAELARMMFECSGDAAVVTDTRGSIAYLNPTAERFAGIGAAKAQGRPVMEILQLRNPKTNEMLQVPVHKVTVETRSMFLPDYTTLVQADGQKMAVDGSLGPVLAADGRVLGTILLLHDVGRYRLLTDALSLQANHDPLTGLANRREFETRVARAVKKAKSHKVQHALCYLDLDKFKIVNDTCGHAAGDELLRMIAGVLRSRLRERDTLARLGGDEFGLLLEGCALAEAQQICAQLLEAVGAIRFSHDGRTYTVGVSIGVYAINADTEDPTSALAAADAACYAAKENGRNRIEVTAPAGKQAHQRQAGSNSGSAAAIVAALKEERFALHLQPIVRTHGDEGEKFFEVLVKMVGVNHDLIPPADFMPAAERYQLMPSLDRWIIKHAFAAYRDAHSSEKGRSAPIWSVNVSGATIASAGFIDFLREQAHAYEIDPRCVCIEISEADAANKTSHVADLIWGLKLDGYRFCIDDFGKAVGSLSLLRALPVDYLKIDGHCVRHMLEDSVSLGIVAAIHQISGIIGASTIAENVESDAVREKLAEIGVQWIQGYNAGRPLPLSALAPPIAAN